MPKYRILEPCFIGGIFRTPGGKHDPLVTAAPLKKIPKYLEEIKSDPEPAKKRAAVTKPNEKPADFMGDTQKDNESGLETL